MISLWQSIRDAVLTKEYNEFSSIYNYENMNLYVYNGSVVGKIGLCYVAMALQRQQHVNR